MRRILTLALICLLPLLAACTASEQALFVSVMGSRQSATAAEVQEAINNPRLACIRYHESDHNKSDGPLFMAGGPTAKNKRSTAGGYYQWVKGSWNNAAKTNGFPEYAHVTTSVAYQVPGNVQHMVTLRYVKKSGTGPWGPDHC